MSQSPSTSSLVLHGRYRIDAKLGTGRLATVYRGYDERLQRPVLVHMLRQELGGNEQLRQRFVEESHASARRSHQSLLEVFDSGEVGQRPYMVTEYVAGRTLRELGALSLEEALLYFRQVVGAVATCQAAGVPHPPISSSNLVLVEDGHVELLENWSTPLNEVAADIACYRAPERTEGKPATDASAVYSLGLLLYEMLTGRRMISGDDAQQIAQAHLTAHIPPLSQVRPMLHVPALEQILARATARRPEDRQPDAATLAHELDEMRRNLNSDTRKLDQPPVESPSLRRKINRRASELVTPRPPR
ncbi:MAG TPA: serine/threonine-protein kinase, partial [Roseiflexaceae bacterium]|nr:serine/threonine-protein kinase [Roseiflexaceae bacterium]